MVVLLGTLLSRQRRYEAFYILHVLMAAVILMGVGLHRPDFWTRSIIIVIFAAALWIPDKTFRAVRTVISSRGNNATLTALRDGGVRVVLERPLVKAQPGTYALLRIRQVRALETHPFTIVSADPLEFVVAAHDGFTRDLHADAVKEPGARLEAGVDGPYGTLPDFSRYDKVVLIAGGSGASFTFAVAVDLVKRLDTNSKMMIEFVWVVREKCKYPYHELTVQKLTIYDSATILVHEGARHAAVLASRQLGHPCHPNCS